jgi:peptidoglycan DL-endopeptidase CwlO
MSLSLPRRAGMLAGVPTLALALLFQPIAPAAPVEASASTGSEASRVISIAKAQVGSRWVMGSTGPASFDCSGLVFYSFKRAGLLSRIGGSRMSASGYWRWFSSRGRTSRANPRRGDLVLYGRGSHIGIYIGNGKAVSALTSGVRIHGVRALTVPFTTYLRVNLSR